MKILISGIGGIGGYIASILCANHKQVTLVARTKRKDALQCAGLQLHSELWGEHTYHPPVTDTPSHLGIQDVIFICVKNPSLPEVLQAIKDCVDDHTIICCIMNGVTYPDVVRTYYPQVRFVPSCIYITSSYQEDYSILQTGNYARIFLGSPDTEAAQVVSNLLSHEGLQCRITTTIQQEMWHKYILNCAYNVSTAYYKGTIADVWNDDSRKSEFYTLLEEATAVGRALRIPLDEQLPQLIYTRTDKQKNKDVTSSLARDIQQGKKGELETFSGFIVHTAATLHIPVPCSQKYYQTLLRAVNAPLPQEK